MKVTKIIKNGERFFIKILKVTTFVVSSLLATSVFSTESTEEVSSGEKDFKGSPELVTRYLFANDKYWDFNGKVVSLNPAGELSIHWQHKSPFASITIYPFYSKQEGDELLYLFGNRQIDDHYYAYRSLVAKNGEKADPASSQTSWKNLYESMAPIYVGSQTYLFGQTRTRREGDGKHYYFISKFGDFVPKDTINTADSGYWADFYDNVFSYQIDNKAFIMGQSKDSQYTFISEITPEGKIGQTTYGEIWNHYYDQLVPVSFEGDAYYFGIKDSNEQGVISYGLGKLTKTGLIAVGSVTRSSLTIGPHRRLRSFPYYDKDGKAYIYIADYEWDGQGGCQGMFPITRYFDDQLMLTTPLDGIPCNGIFSNLLPWNVPTSMSVKEVQ